MQHYAGPIAWSPTSSKLAIASYDTGFDEEFSDYMTFGSRIHIIDPANGNILMLLVQGRSPILSIRWNYEETQLISGTFSGEVYHWDVTTGQQLGYYSLPHMISRLDFSSDNTKIVTGGWENAIRILDLSSQQEVGAIDLGYPEVIGMTASISGLEWLSGNRFLSTGWDGVIRLWDSNTLAQISYFQETDFQILDAQRNSTASLVALRGRSGVVRIWNLDLGQRVAELQHPVEVHDMSWSVDGQRILTAGADKTMRIWDALNGALLGTINVEKDLRYVDWASNGQIAYVGEFIDWNEGGLGVTIQEPPPTPTPTYTPSDTPTKTPTATPTLSDTPTPSDTPSPTSTFTPTPTISEVNGLYGEYYNDDNLSQFVFGRIDSNLSFNWGDGSPDSRIDPDSFSVRWTGKILPQYTETYTFTATYNDGVRLWVDDQLVISDWKDSATRTSSGTIALVGGQKVNIRVEYLEASGSEASLMVWWESPSRLKQVIPTNRLFTMPRGTGAGLRGRYYDGRNFNSHVMTRIDPVIDFSWGQSAPHASMGTEGFSVRWEGQVQPLYTERYSFHTTSNDGVRLWVNGQLLIDDFTNGGLRYQTGRINLVAGVKYDIVLEYFEDVNHAAVKLEWWSDSQNRQVVPQSQLYLP